MTATHARTRQPAPRRRRGGVGSIILGVIGEILITVGLLLALFVVWQLWWTDVEAAQVQQELSQEFETGMPVSPAVVGEAGTGAPPEYGALTEETFARLWVPRWDSGTSPYVRTISQGVDRATVLDVLGIGHYPDTALPGEIGNFSLAAHRQSHGKPFYDIDKLQEGDAIIVETADAWYVYTMVSSQIVLPSQVDVIAPNPWSPSDAPDAAAITLTTCHPLFSTRERFVVHGVLDHWIPREAGRPAELVNSLEG